MNVFNAIGRVGKDAIVRYTQSGKAVAGWSLAVDDGWGQNKQTVWLDCSLWGDRAEKLAPFITKGAQIGVTGSIGTREHDGKTYVTLRVQDVTLLGGKGERDQQQDQQPAHGESQSHSMDGFDDDLNSIPF